MKCPSSLVPLSFATAFMQGLQVSSLPLVVALPLVSLPLLFSHSILSFTINRIILLKEISWLHSQSEADKIKAKPLSFVSPSFLFQFHFLLLAYRVSFACMTLNFFLSLEYARNFLSANPNRKSEGNFIKIRKRCPFLMFSFLPSFLSLIFHCYLPKNCSSKY